MMGEAITYGGSEVIQVQKEWSSGRKRGEERRLEWG